VYVAGAGLTESPAGTFNVVAGDGSIDVGASSIAVGVLQTDAQHGVRGGGTQHAVAVASGAAGFMSGADKALLDGLVAGAVPSSRQVIAGAGLIGGGNLSADRTLNVAAANGTIVVNADSIQVGEVANAQVAAAAAIASTKIDFTAGPIVFTSTTPTSASGDLRYANEVRVPLSVRSAAGNDLAAIAFLGANQMNIGGPASFTALNAFSQIRIGVITGGSVDLMSANVVRARAGDTGLMAFTNQNFSVLGSLAAPSVGGGIGVLGIGTATTAPASNPTGMHVIYRDPADGILKVKSPSGAVATLAVA